VAIASERTDSAGLGVGGQFDGQRREAVAAGVGEQLRFGHGGEVAAAVAKRHVVKLHPDRFHRHR
jgi:hypothetical protein